MGNISFILFSFNEEKRIEHVVRNLLPYGEVILLDGGSTDQTQSIAERWGAKFVTRPKSEKVYVETQEMLEFAKSVAKGTWFFWSYVDNLLPATLLDKLEEISKQDTYKYVYVPIFTYLWGEVKHPIIKASYSCFFRHDAVDFSKNQIHGMGAFTGKPEEILHLPMKLEYAIRHFSLYDVQKFVTGHARYGAAEAEQRYQHGKRFSVVYLFGSMAHYFWLFYKRGFKAGVKGLYIALLYAFFRLIVSVRLYELEHNLNLETIEAAFAEEKKKLVAQAEARKGRNA